MIVCSENYAHAAEEVATDRAHYALIDPNDIGGMLKVFRIFSSQAPEFRHEIARKTWLKHNFDVWQRSMREFFDVAVDNRGAELRGSRLANSR